MALNLVMLGPPGAGKGTQATRLTRRWNIPHISTGAILRDAIKAGTPLGREVQAIIERGGLIDDAVITRIVCERLGQDDGAAGFLLDGFPRTVPQAESLDRFLCDRELVVVEIALTEDDVLRRLASRMICSECGANAQDDREFKYCHDCGGALVPRADDREQVVRERLHVYRQQTAPLVSYYQGRSAYCRVDGSRMVDDVTAEIVKAVERCRGNGAERAPQRTV
jgi:adenylate kinase